MTECVSRNATTLEQRLLAVFDRLYRWFTQIGCRGRAFINAFGELHPRQPETLAGQLFPPVDAAAATTAITEGPHSAETRGAVARNDSVSGEEGAPRAGTTRSTERT